MQIRNVHVATAKTKMMKSDATFWKETELVSEPSIFIIISPFLISSSLIIIAALKCRQRKKKWLSNLQTRVEYLTNDNEQLQMQANTLREEIVHLKTLLLAHKDCPVATGNNPAVAVAAAATAGNNITADTHPHPQRQQCISGASTSPSQHHHPHPHQSSIMAFPVTSSASRVWRY